MKKLALWLFAAAVASGCARPPSSLGRVSALVAPGAGVGSGAFNGGVGSSESSGPPPDIHVGSRITYWNGSALIAGKGFNWTPDDEGNWVDPDSGQHYGKSIKEGTASTSLQEYTVVALDDKQAILALTNYALRQGTAKTFVASIWAGPAASPNGLWVTPSMLLNLPPGTDKEHQTIYGHWPVNGKRVDCVIMKSPNPNGHQFFVYDTHSGLMLDFGSTNVGAASPVTEPGETNTGNTSIAQIQFSGLRQIALPWTSAPDPDCASSFHEMEFEGRNISAGSGRQFTSSLNVKYTLASKGAGWVTCNVTRTQGGIVAGVSPTTLQSKMATGSCMPNPLWINPDVLAKLQPGQLLDTDPVTKIETRVGKSMDGPHGPIITIDMQDQIEMREYGYDSKTGQLVTIHTLDKELALEDILNLKSSN